MNGDDDDDEIATRLHCLHCGDCGMLRVWYLEETDEHVAVCHECITMVRSPDPPPEGFAGIWFEAYLRDREAALGRPITAHRLDWLRAWPLPGPKRR